MPIIEPLVTRSSTSAAEARRRVLSLYRQYLRAAPYYVAYHWLDVPKEEVRRSMRAQFEKNRHVSNVKEIDVLLFKGRLELEEGINIWKQKTHFMRQLEPNRVTAFEKPPSFLAGFLQSKDANI